MTSIWVRWHGAEYWSPNPWKHQVERDSWDEQRLRALCAKHGWAWVPGESGSFGAALKGGWISAAWSWWIFSGATWPILSKMSEYLNQLCFFFSFIIFILPTCVRLPVPSSFIDFPPLRIGSNQPTKDFEWMTEAVGVLDLRWLVLMPFWDPKRIPPENWTPQGPSFFLGALHVYIIDYMNTMIYTYRYRYIYILQSNICA